MVASTVATPLMCLPYTPTITYIATVKITRTTALCATKLNGFIQTKMRGQGSLELAQENRKKEGRQMAIFWNIWFWDVQLNDLDLVR